MQVLLDFWWFVPLALVASFITAAVGSGGNTLLFLMMSAVMPVAVVLPVQGVVMTVENGFRSGLLWRRIDWPFVGVAAAGSVIGAVLAGPLLMTVPDDWMRMVVAVSLLYLVWLPKLKMEVKLPWVSQETVVAVMAAVVSVVTMFIGAAGVLFSAIRYRFGRRKEGLLADQGVVMLVQQGIKVAAFAMTGFAFGPYVLLIAGMLVAGLTGSYFGVQAMKRMHNRRFDRYFKIAVTFVAISIVLRVVF